MRAFSGDDRLCTIQERMMHTCVCVLEHKAIEINVATCILESVYSIILIFKHVALVRIAESYFSHLVQISNKFISINQTVRLIGQDSAIKIIFLQILGWLILCYESNWCDVQNCSSLDGPSTM